MTSMLDVFANEAGYLKGGKFCNQVKSRVVEELARKGVKFDDKKMATSIKHDVQNYPDITLRQYQYDQQKFVESVVSRTAGKEEFNVGRAEQVTVEIGRNRDMLSWDLVIALWINT